MGRALLGGGKVGMKAPSVSRLPAGYTELAYIQSDGASYIDTGIVPDANTKVEMDFQLITAGTGNRALFAVAGQFSFRWYGSSSVFRANGKNNVDFTTGIDGTARHTVVKTATSCVLDDTYSVTTTAGTVTLSLYLLAQHTATGASNYATAKLYSCKMYDGATLTRDFVPCVDANGNIGLYDLVNSQFYGNAGTGTFIGSEVA